MDFWLSFTSKKSQNPFVQITEYETQLKSLWQTAEDRFVMVQNGNTATREFSEKAANAILNNQPAETFFDSAFKFDNGTKKEIRKMKTAFNAFAETYKRYRELFEANKEPLEKLGKKLLFLPDLLSDNFKQNYSKALRYHGSNPLVLGIGIAIGVGLKLLTTPFKKSEIA